MFEEEDEFENEEFEEEFEEDFDPMQELDLEQNYYFEDEDDTDDI